MKVGFIYDFQFAQELPPYSYFDIAEDNSTFITSLDKSDEDNWLSFIRLIDILKKHKKVNVTLNLSGLFLGRLQAEPKILAQVNKLIKNDQIELLASPFYNSLSVLFSRELFNYEVKKHSSLLEDLFSNNAAGFINSALIYVNDLAEVLQKLGFSYAIVPSIDWYIPQQKESVVFNSTTDDFWIAPIQLKSADTDGFRYINSEAFTKTDEKQLIKSAGKSLTINDELDKDAKVYSLPQIVVSQDNKAGLEMIIGNNLQKELLSRLKQLSPKIEAKSDAAIKDKLLSIGSLANFQLIADTVDAKDRYEYYLTLQNMLYSLELSLR